MDGRIIEFRTTNRKSRVDRVVPVKQEKTAEMTRLLHNLMTDVARVHRGQSEISPPPRADRTAGQELAAALPNWKRLLDLLLVALLFPVWLPVMTLIALWVAVTSPGPIFYRQPRVGFKGRRFMLMKFRTMKVNAETHVHEAYLEHLIISDRPMIKLDATDPRLILGGKFLRATGLDELPQIFNVLKGEMSLVGPRPCTVGEFERYAPEHRARGARPDRSLAGQWQKPDNLPRNDRDGYLLLAQHILFARYQNYPSNGARHTRAACRLGATLACWCPPQSSGKNLEGNVISH